MRKENKGKRFAHKFQCYAVLYWHASGRVRARAFNMFSYLLCSDILLLAIHSFCAKPHATDLWLQLRLHFALVSYEIHLQWSKCFVFRLWCDCGFRAVVLFLCCKRACDGERNVHTMCAFLFHSHTHTHTLCGVSLLYLVVNQLFQFGELHVDVSVLFSKFYLGHTHTRAFFLLRSENLRCILLLFSFDSFLYASGIWLRCAFAHDAFHRQMKRCW